MWARSCGPRFVSQNGTSGTSVAIGIDSLRSLTDNQLLATSYACSVWLVPPNHTCDTPASWTPIFTVALESPWLAVTSHAPGASPAVTARITTPFASVNVGPAASAQLDCAPTWNATGTPASGFCDR